MTRRATGSVVLAAAALAVSLSACNGASTQTSSAPATQRADPSVSAPAGSGDFTSWPAQVYSPYYETWINRSLPVAGLAIGGALLQLRFPPGTRRRFLHAELGWFTVG